MFHGCNCYLIITESSVGHVLRRTCNSNDIRRHPISTIHGNHGHSIL